MFCWLLVLSVVTSCTQWKSLLLPQQDGTEGQNQVSYKNMQHATPDWKEPLKSPRYLKIRGWSHCWHKAKTQFRGDFATTKVQTVKVASLIKVAFTWNVHTAWCYQVISWDMSWSLRVVPWLSFSFHHKCGLGRNFFNQVGIGLVSGNEALRCSRELGCSLEFK